MKCQLLYSRIKSWCSDRKESACKCRRLGLIPGSGRHPGEGTGYLLQYSGLIPWTEEPIGYSPWGRKELNVTEQLTLLLFFFQN